MVSKRALGWCDMVAAGITCKWIVFWYHQKCKMENNWVSRSETPLLSPVSDKAHFASAFNFASDLALMLSAAASFFARQNFVLSAYKLTQHLTVAQGRQIQVAGAKNTDGVTSFFHKLKRDIFNTNLLFAVRGRLDHGRFGGHSRLLLSNRAWNSGAGVVSAAAKHNHVIGHDLGAVLFFTG